MLTISSLKVQLHNSFVRIYHNHTILKHVHIAGLDHNLLRIIHERWHRILLQLKAANVVPVKEFIVSSEQ